MDSAPSQPASTPLSPPLQMHGRVVQNSSWTWWSSCLEWTVYHIGLWHLSSGNQRGMELKKEKKNSHFSKKEASAVGKSPGRGLWSWSSSPAHHMTLETASKFLNLVSLSKGQEHRALWPLNPTRGTKGNMANAWGPGPFFLFWRSERPTYFQVLGVGHHQLQAFSRGRFRLRWWFLILEGWWSHGRSYHSSFKFRLRFCTEYTEFHDT